MISMENIEQNKCKMCNKVIGDILVPYLSVSDICMACYPKYKAEGEQKGDKTPDASKCEDCIHE